MTERHRQRVAGSDGGNWAWRAARRAGYTDAMFTAVLAVLLFVIDVLVILKILGSGHSGVAKLVWVLVVLFLPLVGPVLYLVVGNQPKAITRV